LLDARETSGAIRVDAALLHTRATYSDVRVARAAVVVAVGEAVSVVVDVVAAQRVSPLGITLTVGGRGQKVVLNRHYLRVDNPTSCRASKWLNAPEVAFALGR
jgi:hypothetical protein